MSSISPHCKNSSDFPFVGGTAPAPAPVSMGSNSRRPFRLLTLLVFGCFALAAGAKPASVCPKLGPVSQIDLFDGRPDEQATLAPDDPETAPNTYTLSQIYKQGRIVTIRCHYKNGQVRDIPLRKPVSQCRYSEHKDLSGTLICR